MDVKRKAALTTSSLHDAHSELENIARQADEEDLSAPDEVAALSMLIDELLSVSAGQKQKLKEKHKLSIEMMRDFVSTQLAGCMEDKARLAELEVSKSLLEKKAELEKEVGEEIDMELPQEGGTTATVAVVHPNGVMTAWVRARARARARPS